MLPLVTYWRNQCFDAYEALLEIERCAEHGASNEVIAHLARNALDTPRQEHDDRAQRP